MNPADRSLEHIYKESAPVDFNPFAADLLASVPATEPQREIWAAASLSPEASCAYNESRCLELHRHLDTGAMAHALSRLAQRHDALRATFGPDGQALCIAREIALDVTPVDLRHSDTTLDALRAHEVTAPFDLINGPLFRCRIVHIDDYSHAVLLTAHHTVCDGWSFSVLFDELAQLYSAAVRGEADDPEPAPSFAAYA